MSTFTLTTADAPDWGIKLGDEQLVLRTSEVGIALASELRTASGGLWRWPTLVPAVVEGVGPEELAGMVFVARRQAGQTVTWREVCAQIDELNADGADIVLDYCYTDPGDDSPEA